MEKLNNPAARLYDLLQKGKSQKMDISIAQAWANLLNVQVNNQPLLLKRIGSVIELPSLIEKSITETTGVNHEIYLRWLSRVNGSFGIINFQTQWSSFISRFDVEIMYGIEICADMLSRTTQEKVISEPTLNELRDKIEQLLNEFSIEDLPIEIGQFILQRLIEIKEAIEEYPFRGTSPLESVLERSIGSIVISPNIYHDSKETTFGKKFWEVMGYIAIVVTITAGSIRIGQETVSLFQNNSETISVEPKALESNEDRNLTSDYGVKD